MDSDGSKQLRLGEKDTLDQIYRHGADGFVIDWMDGLDGNVLMSRAYVPEKSTGKITARIEEGLGVARVDTRTGKSAPLEKPGDDVVEYISDGLGSIRLMTTTHVAESGYLTRRRLAFLSQAGRPAVAQARHVCVRRQGHARWHRHGDPGGRSEAECRLCAPAARRAIRALSHHARWLDENRARVCVERRGRRQRDSRGP